MAPGTHLLLWMLTALFFLLTWGCFEIAGAEEERLSPHESAFRACGLFFLILVICCARAA